ncbi:MAG: PQQ-binding-like beta-propeller repeat protein [Acidobacteria bacterium]|nr:PQQ-binding-like beta-propeller repeat protein [Acidobacteriota bacterium]
MGILSCFLLLAFARAADWPMWGGEPTRNMVSEETGMPEDWDIKSGRNIRWVAALGSQSYGNTVVSRGKIFVGTNNELVRNPALTGDRGVIMAFRESDGKFLWQATSTKLAAGRVNDWPEQGVCSSPAVVGDRLYYVSNRCELVCLDTEGFLDKENDGPFTEEEDKAEIDGDVIWKLDMVEELGVFPHNLATSSPLVVGDLVFICTSNGVDESHINIPVPLAPSFIAVNRHTGEVVWEDDSPAENIVHGQWSSPAYGVVNGKPQVIFPGGDGYLYAFEPETGKKIWWFDCNPKGSEWKGGRGTKNNLIATPVVYDNKVFIAVGQDPEHGEGAGHLWAIDATKEGDVTDSAVVWHYDFRRTISTVAIQNGLLFAANLTGFLHCIDLETGKKYWEHDLLAAVWGSPYLVDGKLYIGDEDGDVTVLAASKEKKVIAEMNMGNSAYGTAVAANGVLYIMTRSDLYSIAK